MAENMANQDVNRAGGRLLGWLFLIVALFVLGVGLLYGNESWQLAQNGRSVAGKVVDFQQRVSDEDEQVSYAPIVEYRIDGQTYRFAGDNYKNRPAYAIGEAVDVLYDPEEPDQARMNDFANLWGIPLALVGVGVLLLVISLGMLRRKRSA